MPPCVGAGRVSRYGAGSKAVVKGTSRKGGTMAEIRSISTNRARPRRSWPRAGQRSAPTPARQPLCQGAAAGDQRQCRNPGGPRRPPWVPRLASQDQTSRRGTGCERGWQLSGQNPGSAEPSSLPKPEREGGGENQPSTYRPCTAFALRASCTELRSSRHCPLLHESQNSKVWKELIKAFLQSKVS